MYTNSSNQPRSAKDFLLLSLWVFGYQLLIRSFCVLQRVERLLGASKPG